MLDEGLKKWYYISRTHTSYADVAQLAEQLTCNQQVIGSSPIIGFFPAYLQGEGKYLLFFIRFLVLHEVL